jgi:hypothetical protein
MKQGKAEMGDEKKVRALVRRAIEEVGTDEFGKLQDERKALDARIRHLYQLRRSLLDVQDRGGLSALQEICLQCIEQEIDRLEMQEEAPRWSSASARRRPSISWLSLKAASRSRAARPSLRSSSSCSSSATFRRDRQFNVHLLETWDRVIENLDDETKSHLDMNSKLVFVHDPNLRGRWMRTDPSVITVACPYPGCESPIGVPCRSSQGYSTHTHAMRREEAKIAKREARKQEKEKASG